MNNRLKKYAYLVAITSAHCGWFYWLAVNAFWRSNLKSVDYESFEEAETTHIPFEYTLSQYLFYAFSLMIVLAHALYLWKSGNAPGTKLRIEAASFLIPLSVPLLLLLRQLVT